jgi:hypothetical protein
MRALLEIWTFIRPDLATNSNNFYISGSPGTGAHFHIDNVHQSSWQAQVSFFYSLLIFV